MAHPRRDTRFDPLLKGCSHFRKCSDGSFELYMQLSRFTTPRSASQSFWLPWALVAVNDAWQKRIQNRWSLIEAGRIAQNDNTEDSGSDYEDCACVIDRFEKKRVKKGRARKICPIRTAIVSPRSR